jgi:DNA-binding HxlR family transcriptional regulator
MSPAMLPKVKYQLSEFGKTLTPVIDALIVWSRTHETKVRAILERKELVNQSS